MNPCITTALTCGLALSWAATSNAVQTITVGHSTFSGMKTVDIENRSIRVRVLPDRGANIISIYDKRSGREWMWQNTSAPYHVVKYGSNFIEQDASGFDDCFPTVAENPYPDDPWKGILMPDHGEIWTQPATYTICRDSVRFRVQGIRLPFVFEKEISLSQPGVVTIRYSISNPTPVPIRGAWAGHSLVNVNPGMEMFLPEETKILDGMGAWPIARAYNLRWIRIAGPETKTAIKRFTDRLTEGWGGFYDGRTKDFLAYVFSPRQLPYFGVFINQDGIPEMSSAYNAALEPTNGDENYDSATAKGIAPSIAASSKLQWQLNIVVGNSKKEDLRRCIKEAEKRIQLR